MITEPVASKCNVKDSFSQHYLFFTIQMNNEWRMTYELNVAVKSIPNDCAYI